MRLVFILALCVWSCQGVRGFSCLYPDLPDVLLEPNLDSYKNNSTAHYVCKKGKKNVLETCWGEIQCVNGAWSPLPQCVDESSCITPHVPHAKPEANLEHFYPTGAKVEFKCNKAYRFASDNPFASCENGQWDLPVCIRRQDICDPPAPVANAVSKEQLKDLYEDGETVEFVCKPGFEMIAGETSTCWGTKWMSKPECVRKEPENQNRQPQPVSACGELPHVHNGTVSPQKNKMALVVSCNEFHRLVGPKTVRCTDGKWTKLPVCQPPCELDEHLVQYSNVKSLQEGEMKTLRCHYYPAYHRRVSCEKGEAQYGDCLRHNL